MTDLYTSALDWLDQIPDATWERVMGDQDRATFAHLAIDAGQDIAAAWADAVHHAANL